MEELLQLTDGQMAVVDAYLATKGYRAHYEPDDTLCGWIMKEKD